MSAVAIVALVLQAAQLGVPAGAGSFDPGGVVCEAPPEGWQLAADRRKLKPPAGARPGTQVVLSVAPTAEGCGTAMALTVTVVGPAPVVDAASIRLFPDTGRLELAGANLEGAALHWRAGSRDGAETCVGAGPGGPDCIVSVPRDVDAEALRLVALPAGFTEGMQLLSAAGAPVGLEPTLRPARFVVDTVIGAQEAVSLEREPALLRVRHPEAVEDVSCVDADCGVDGDAVTIRRERGSDSELELRARLRPHWFVTTQGSPDPAPTYRVPIQRCPVSVASPPPLQGVAGQRLVLKVGGQCARDEQLTFETSAGRVGPSRSVAVGAERFVVLALGAVGVGDQAVRALHQERVWGQASTPTRPAPPVRAALTLPGVGPVDFVPTNRDVAVETVRLSADAVLEPAGVDGVYQVSGGRLVRALQGIAGRTPLHFAYRSTALPAALGPVTLAELVEPIDREIHAADVPIDLRTSRAVWMQCGDGDGGTVEPRLDATTIAPYRARNTCRLRFDRAAVPRDRGRQLLSVRVRISSAEQVARSDADRDQRLVLSADQGPSELVIEGVQAPFDRLVVTVSHVVDAGQLVDEGNTIDGLRWTVVFGTQRARLYASATFPSGLFRVSEPAHSGVLTLNAGAVLRLVWLTRDGQESPLGLESGILWTSIAGDLESQLAPHGQVAIVTGLGVGIPIANAGRGTQTSINLHAWVEFEASRAVAHQAGSPWGFIFGPSLTVGDLGASF